MGTEMEVILGLCRIPYERARMTDQEPKTERALTVEDHAKRQRESCEIGCSIFPQGETVIVTSRELTILSLFFFPFLQPEPFRQNAPQRCPLRGASHLRLAGLTSITISKVLSTDTPIQRTASTLSAGFPKVAERVRTLGAWLYVPSCRFAAPDQVRWRVHCKRRIHVFFRLFIGLGPHLRSPSSLATVLAKRSLNRSKRYSSLSMLQ